MAGLGTAHASQGDRLCDRHICQAELITVFLSFALFSVPSFLPLSLCLSLSLPSLLLLSLSLSLSLSFSLSFSLSLSLSLSLLCTLLLSLSPLGKILFRRSHVRDVAMKRLRFIDDYCRVRNAWITTADHHLLNM